MHYRGNVTRYPKEVLELEKAFGNYIGVKNALSFCNGTSAFNSALSSLKLSAEDEIITSGLSFYSIILSVLLRGHNITYLDIDKNLNMVLDDNKISTNAKLIIVSHLFGYSQNMEDIAAFAKKHNLKIIEDCSHAHGAEYNKSKVGSFGDISFFSFQGSKAVSGGEAGFALTNDTKYYNRMKLYSHTGRDMSDFVSKDSFFSRSGFGLKGRMHPFAAALATVELNNLEINNFKMKNNLKNIQMLVRSIDGIDCIEPCEFTSTGGYHYGIPIWVQSQETVNQLINNNKIKFRPYPYLNYSKHSYFKNSKLYHKKITSDELNTPEDTRSELPVIDKAIKNLVFLDLNFVKYYDSLRGKELVNLLKLTSSHEN
jgi:perosamine synthetase